MGVCLQRLLQYRVTLFCRMTDQCAFCWSILPSELFHRCFGYYAYRVSRTVLRGPSFGERAVLLTLSEPSVHAEGFSALESAAQRNRARWICSRISECLGSVSSCQYVKSVAPFPTDLRDNYTMKPYIGLKILQ